MSTYHKWRCVFVQVPKNASSTIHKVLSNQTDDSHDHNTYLEILANHDPELIESYYSFGVIRNPYDRFVSAYEWVKQNSSWPLSFEETVDEWSRRGPFFYTTEDVAWWPQHRYLCIKGILLIDDLIRFETLHQDWQNIVSKIAQNLPNTYSEPSLILSHENKTHIREDRDWKQYYNEDLAQKVHKLYKKDFEIFKYDPNDFS